MKVIAYLSCIVITKTQIMIQLTFVIRSLARFSSLVSSQNTEFYIRRVVCYLGVIEILTKIIDAGITEMPAEAIDQIVSEVESRGREYAMENAILQYC